MRRPLAVALATAALVAAVAVAVRSRLGAGWGEGGQQAGPADGRQTSGAVDGPGLKPGAADARSNGGQSPPLAGGGLGRDDKGVDRVPSGAEPQAAEPSAEAEAPSPWLGPGGAGAEDVPDMSTAVASAHVARAPAAPKPQAPPPLTDPLKLEAPKVPGPTLKPAASGAGRAGAASEAHPSRAVALYHEAERALVAGRGRECLSSLDRADATPPDGADLREREQRASSKVVRAQCTMLLAGGCDEGAARLRAAGWPDAAIEGARAKFCGPRAAD
jgi:hypothetical protein